MAVNETVQISGLRNSTSYELPAMQRYIDASCGEAVNRIVGTLFLHMLTNVTNLMAHMAENMTNNTSHNRSSFEQATLLLGITLEAYMASILRSDATVQSAVIDVVTKSDALSSAVNDGIAALKNNGNIFFLLAMAIFIFSMQSGFALLEVGLVRTKNVSNSMWKNICYSFVSVIAYWLVGMALSFGKSSGHFAGITYWAFRDMPVATGQGVDWMLFFFEYVFCTTAGAIMSGPIAERAQLICYVLYVFWASAITYPIVVHWCWNAEGWLLQGGSYNINGADVTIGYEDFAGSGVVHACGGVAALVATIFVGPRIGRFGANGQANEIKGHSLTLVCLGSGILFTGFLAFNAGSRTMITNDGDAVFVNRAAVNTIITGTGGLLTVLITYRIIYKAWLVIPMLCGGLVGNVAACCNCDVVEAWGAFCIGIFSGFCFMGVSWALRKLKIDDAVDAVGVHVGGGFAGCIGLAFFKINIGIFYNFDKRSALVLAWQMLGFSVISLWSALHTFVIFYILKMLNMVRVEPEAELLGLDYAHGHEVAYNMEAYSKPNINSSSGKTELSESEVYSQLLKEEMSRYSQDEINHPGWSMPVFGGVLWDLQWISVVRRFNKEAPTPYVICTVENSTDVVPSENSPGLIRNTQQASPKHLTEKFGNVQPLSDVSTI